MLTRELRTPPRKKLWILLGASTTALLIAWIYNAMAAPNMGCFCSSKEKIARIAVRKFVYEALQQWQALHGVHCPPDLTALTPFMNSDDVSDPWGHPYVLVCDSHRAAAISSGPDGTLGLDEADYDDDIVAITAWSE